MQKLDDNRAYWFVLGTKSVNKEIDIRDEMRHRKMECFVPLKYVVKRVRGLQQESLVPAISGLIFAHATADDLKEYLETSKHSLYLRRATFSENQQQKDFLIVEDREMERFINFVRANAQKVNFFRPEELTWVEGDLVRVTIGSTSYEGQIVRIKGKRHFALSLRNSLFSTVQITPDLMQSIERYSEDSGKWEGMKGDVKKSAEPRERKQRAVRYSDRDERKSKDLEGDKKLLMTTARKLLFNGDDMVREDHREYVVAQKELERVMKRVAPYTGVTAALEGELALAMFLGTAARGEDTTESAERVRKAIAKLVDTSMLKFRMRFYLAKLTDDSEEMQRISETVKSWNHRRLQRKQQEFMDEVGDYLMHNA